MKKILSALITAFLLFSYSSVFASGAEITLDGELNIYNTVIEVPGISGTYKFLQISDTHVAVVPDDEEKFDYAHAVSRNRHFDSYTESNYLDMIGKYYSFAEKENVNAVLMTGDIIDFPSAENIDFLYNSLNSTNLTTLFTLGNHDWTYPDASFGYGAYMSSAQYSAFQPLLEQACTVEECGNTGNCHGSYMDFGEIVVVMLDDSEDMFNYKESYIVLKNALNLGKPTIVCYHSPLYSPTLTEDVVAMWKTNQIVGSHRGPSMWPLKTSRVVSMLESNENVIGLFCGHVHFDHEDVSYDSAFSMSSVIPNNAVQYCCPPGYNGNCRLITIRGTDYECEHEYTSEEFYPANCNIRGVNKLTCTKCGKEKKEIVDYTTHSYVSEVAVAPTCLSTGILRYTCAHCGDTYKEELPKTNHDYVLETVVAEPTATSVGVGFYRCSTCDATSYQPIPVITAVKGDIDGDGRISLSDSVVLKKILIGEIFPDYSVKYAADFDSNGRISVLDFMYLKRYISGGGIYFN